MRIVGIRRDGVVEVAALSDDDAQVTVVAGLEEFWADAAGHLARGASRRDAGRRPTSSSCPRCCPAPG